MAFDAFDTDQSGSIDVTELSEAMKSMGKEMTQAEIRELISNVAEEGSTES